MKPKIGVGVFAYIFWVLNSLWKNTNCLTFCFVNLISVQLTECSLNIAYKADVKQKTSIHLETKFCGVFFFPKRISIEGALLSQATKLGSNEALLSSRKKVSLEPSGLKSQFQESSEPAYSSDQDENLQTSAMEQIDADDEEESEQVGKRGEKSKIPFSWGEWKRD